MNLVFLSVTLIWLQFIPVTIGCMATHGSRPAPSTTPRPPEDPIDSTTAPTTTIPPDECGCDQGDVTFQLGDGQLLIDSFGQFVGEPDADTKCRQIEASCSADDGHHAFMQFNIDEGGPKQQGAPTVTALLTCIDRMWYYVEDGIQRHVYDVSCNQAVI